MDGVENEQKDASKTQGHASRLLARDGFLVKIPGKCTLVLGRYGRTISEAPYDSESEIETAMDQEADLEKFYG